MTRDLLAPGDRIGDYKIERGLSVDEHGLVYLGTHVVLPRRAEIKVMYPGTWTRAVAVQMLREACIREALGHPGVPRVYECGVLADRRPWTASEHLDGTTIAEAIASAPLSIADLTSVLRDTAALLHHAHARGVVHRQLTADAIVRTPDRSFGVCVRDWGDALTLDTEAHVRVNARDDVHALGVIAFRALTGQLPDRTVSAADRCPAAPDDLTALIDRMLATDPAARPTSADVHDRVRWLADTVVPLAIDRPLRPTDVPRWTPPHGLPPDQIPVIEDDGFAVRITRKP
ncbi:MAG: hypothetical protein KF773_11095 [Deltaproteobacteria bacterium]|nr:hypothetical protein [Deltaproteobacteria bacterium]MCW5801505.1 hypothetical protein [Deltaproteobacteria bacterium]